MCSLVCHIKGRPQAEGVRKYEGVLREMFRTEREGVARNWRTLQHEELCALHCLPDLIRVIKLKGA